MKEEEKKYNLFLNVWKINIFRMIDDLIIYGKIHNIELSIIKVDIEQLINKYIEGV